MQNFLNTEELYKLEALATPKIFDIKSNLQYTRGIALNRATSGEAHLYGSAPGQHRSEETSQRWRTVGMATLRPIWQARQLNLRSANCCGVFKYYANQRIAVELLKLQMKQFKLTKYLCKQLMHLLELERLLKHLQFAKFEKFFINQQEENTNSKLIIF